MKKKWSERERGSVKQRIFAIRLFFLLFIMRGAGNGRLPEIYRTEYWWIRLLNRLHRSSFIS